jgi:hypothetical protein
MTFDQFRASVAHNITLLEIIRTSSVQGDTLYLVQYPCCGRDDELSHKVIVRRVRNETQFCRYCAAANRRNRSPHAIPSTNTKDFTIYPDLPYPAPLTSIPAPGDDHAAA